MKSRVLLLLWAIGCVVVLTSCQRTPPIVGQAFPNWGGFGEPGQDTIKVFISGNVEHPGLYHFHRGMDVATACAIAGAVRAGYGHIDPVFYLDRAEGRGWHYDPRESLSRRRKIAALELRDGDKLFVSMFIH